MKRTINITASFDIAEGEVPMDKIVEDLKREFATAFSGLEEFKGLKVEVVYE